MTVENLSKMSKEEVLDFIRQELSFDSSIKEQLRHVDKEIFAQQEHKRFDMSGYEDIAGQNTIFNQSIVNIFAKYGIYDYTSYLFLDFYKGMPTLYLKYFNGSENLEYDLSGYTTSEIIYEILSLTIFSDKGQRRRI